MGSRMSRIGDEREELGRKAVSLGPGLPAVPERLLLAHARGEVLFVCGAGVSKSSGLPDFRELVCDVYRTLDSSVHEVLCCIETNASSLLEEKCSRLNYNQRAEVRRFLRRDYDVVLGMLERRLDGRTRGDSKVRARVVELLRVPESRLESGAAEQSDDVVACEGSAAPANARPSMVHKALMRLADRGGATTIVTTNFDLLLQDAARSLRVPVQTYSLGAIPRPTRRREFAGVFHIHGALDRKPDRVSDLILTDQDFGEFYLRRRIVPDFIYDAARLFHIVLVGYSANDPPMRYLLNAVAADESRFDDLKDRFVVFGTDGDDPVELEDWKGRGIVPIPYPAPNHDHSVLGETLSRWADLSANNGRRRVIDKEVRRIVKTARGAASEADQGLFDHLFGRSDPTERARLAELASGAGAEPGWLEAMMTIEARQDLRRLP